MQKDLPEQPSNVPQLFGLSGSLSDFEILVIVVNQTSSSETFYVRALSVRHTLTAILSFACMVLSNCSDSWLQNLSGQDRSR